MGLFADILFFKAAGEINERKVYCETACIPGGRPTLLGPVYPPPIFALTRDQKLDEPKDPILRSRGRSAWQTEVRL